ncbi:hypothetical protein ES703_67922 [subsurface metagenome]
MTSSQAKKSTDQSNIKPFLLVQYPSQGRPSFRLLNIKYPHLNNSGSRSNNHKYPVHISKVIEGSLFLMSTNDTLRRHVDKRGC